MNMRLREWHGIVMHSLKTLSHRVEKSKSRNKFYISIFGI